MSDTLNALRGAILSTTERALETDPVPDAIARICAAREGKPLTKRDIAALKEEFPGLTVYSATDKHSGRVELTWYQSTSIDHATKQPAAPTDWDPDAKKRQTEYLALRALGVPDYNNRRSVDIRRGDWSSRVGGVCRWPSVDSLKEWNRWCYDTRDERNSERAETLSVVSDPASLSEIASIVDALLLMEEELAGQIRLLPDVARGAVRVAVDAMRTEHAQKLARQLERDDDTPNEACEAYTELSPAARVACRRSWRRSGR